MVASSSNQNVNGTFNVFEDDNRLELASNFGSNTGFQELNDDWYFVLENDLKIRFEDNDEDGENIIEFQK